MLLLCAVAAVSWGSPLLTDDSDSSYSSYDVAFVPHEEYSDESHPNSNLEQQESQQIAFVAHHDLQPAATGK